MRRYIASNKLLVLVTGFIILLEVPTQLIYPFIWMYIVDVVVGKGELNRLIPVTVVWIGVQLLGQALRAIRTFLTERLGQSFSRSIRSALHSRVLHMTWEGLEDVKSGDLVARFGSDTDAIERFLSSDLPSLLIQSLGFILVIGALVWINAILTVVVVLPVVLVAVAVRWYNSRVAPAYQKSAVEFGSISAVFEEDVTGARAIQALSAEETRNSLMIELLQRLFQIRMGIVWKRIMIGDNIMGLIAFTGTVCMISLGGLLVIRGHMTLGGLVAFLGYAWRLPVGANIIASAVDIWNRSKVAWGRLQAFTDEGYVSSTKDTVPEMDRVIGEIEFNINRFVYPTRSEASLVDIEFSARPGDIICLAGHSGSGKSTILALMGGFYQPEANQGQVKLDGSELNKSNARSYRHYMSIVLQDTFIWNDTVEANIRIGSGMASKDQIEKAARSASAHDFILDLPKGYDTMIGERGMRLSGGQRQRLGVARAFVSNPSIILMDEPTSSVERKSEDVVIKALKALSTGRTTIIASHKPIFAERATEVIFLENGRIICKGPHRELLDKSMEYRMFMGYETD